MSEVAAYVGHERDVAREAWEGIVTWRTLVSADRTPSVGLTVGTAEIAPGATEVGARHHHADHEVYYVIAGTGVVHLDGVETPVEPGSVVFIPGNTRHFVRNTGHDTLKLLFAFSVDRFSDVHYVHDDEAPSADPEA
jgi:quercetin dioxygenase-like cupin family protein